ncbi:MAG: 4Fe-4S ferredoxin [Deltaproteobacteria bacterium HGW-Deltaproteobacteria-19]|jgi:NAD-dependent dihydropyrimidine dehydrogenase PreA subunit|nr:MAG: 4Fe-4S ferredoxin [Deltaproteobacteria bacterium HGW-Deltaproteobacteria-19]
MSQDVFRLLQQYLDRLSLGFPPTESGVEIEILRKLFTERDAALFLALSPRLEIPADVATRLNRDTVETAEHLRDMASRGLLFTLRKGDVVKYGTIPFVHGLFEFHLNRLDREFSELLERYFHEAFNDAITRGAAAFLRTVPVRESLDVSHHVAAYEDAVEILRGQPRIVVAECICRKQQSLLGKGCGKPREACFMFGSMGQYYLDHGLGREVGLEEAVRLLKEAQDAGLVTQPATAQNPGGMCNCCGDCCSVLRALRLHSKPVEMVFSNHYAGVDPDACTGCGACLQRCQMTAITMDEYERARIDRDRCIGCGLCATACPVEALRLFPKEEQRVPPPGTMEQMLNMARLRGLA